MTKSGDYMDSQMEKFYGKENFNPLKSHWDMTKPGAIRVWIKTKERKLRNESSNHWQAFKTKGNRINQILRFLERRKSC